MTSRQFAFITLAALISVLMAIAPALAHHILGIPHYAYDEQYPQTPVLTYKANFGPHEISMTGYPGRPAPGERCNYSVYITRIDNAEPFDGTVSLTIFKDHMLGGDETIYGPVEAQLDQAVYKFYPEFGGEANYIARIEYFAEDAPWTIDLPVVVGEPGNPLFLLAGIGGGVVVFLVIIRALRIKLKRRRELRDSTLVDPSP